MIGFAHPAALVLLALLPALALSRRAARRRGAESIEVPALPPASPSIRSRLAVIPRLAAGAGLAAAVMALAGPRRVERRAVVGSSGVNIAVALDVSGSMAAEDFQPRNRLEVARSVVADFIAGRPADSIALLTFAGRAATVCPATDDHATLLALLSQVGSSDLPDGTAIGNAIATGVARLKDLPGKSRVLVLVTDGANNAGQIDPETAARMARAFGVRIHTIAVGRGGRVPITVTVRDPDTGRTVRRRIEADVKVDEALLRRISASTGGVSFRATDSRALARIFGEIDRMEKSPAPVRYELVVTDLSFAPKAASAALLLLALLLGSGPLRVATEAA
jgi:Ca-activated chloride channel family protein